MLSHDNMIQRIMHLERVSFKGCPLLSTRGNAKGRWISWTFIGCPSCKITLCLCKHLSYLLGSFLELVTIILNSISAERSSNTNQQNTSLARVGTGFRESWMQGPWEWHTNPAKSNTTHPRKFKYGCGTSCTTQLADEDLVVAICHDPDHRLGGPKS